MRLIRVYGTVYVEIFARRKFSLISPSALIGEIFMMNFLSCVHDYIEDMVTFTALMKTYSTEYFFNTKVAGLGEIFVKQNFHIYGILNVTRVLCGVK